MWPQVSITIENILRDALSLGVAVEIPNAVLYELERNWQERTRSLLSETTKSLKILDFLVGGVTTELPDWTALETGYRKAVEALVEKWSISVTPLPLTSVEELFKYACQKDLVFEQEGKNFQDAVILLSAIHRMENNSECAVLVSEDGIFHRRHAEWSQLVLQLNINLSPIRRKELRDHFFERLAEDLKLRINRHKYLATEAVRTFLPQFQELVNKQEHSVQEAMAVTGMQNCYWNDAILGKVIDVDVPHFESEPPAGSNVRFSAVVGGSVLETREYLSNSNDERTFTQRKIFEIAMSVVAMFNGSQYAALSLLGYSFGTPGHLGRLTLASFPKPQII
jgi:hypothetical protein